MACRPGLACSLFLNSLWAKNGIYILKGSFKKKKNQNKEYAAKTVCAEKA